ncbi:MAG: bacteriohemerythrin [bacterium]
MSWNKNLEVGISTVDSQHKNLINKLNEFLDACIQKKGKDELMGMIKFLESYIAFHFKTEEDIIQRHKFPGYTAHKAMHDDFIKEFLKIKNRVEVEGATLELVNSITRFLTSWLVEHISKIDKQLSNII